MRKERFIRIDSRWVANGEIRRLGHITFAVYVVLVERMMIDGSILVTLKHILDTLGINKKTTQTVNKVKEALVMLQDRGYVTAVTSFISNEEIELIEEIQINELIHLYAEVPTKFIMLKTQELNMILDLADAEKKRALLAYFSSIVFHINNETKACFPSLEILGKEARISNDSTCILYNEQLKELGLLIYMNVGIKAGKEAKRRQGMNVYARPEHLEELKKEVKQIQERDKYYFVTERVKSLVNQQRSVKQKLNRLLKNGEYESLSLEEQKQIDTFRVEHQRLQSEYKQADEEYQELHNKHKKRKKVKGGQHKKFVDLTHEDMDDWSSISYNKIADEHMSFSENRGEGAYQPQGFYEDEFEF